MALALSPAPDRVDDLISLPPEGKHLEHDLRRVLQVAVHYHNGVPGGEVEACRDRHLVSEAASQNEQLESRIPVAEAGYQLAASVGAAVVDEDELAFAVHLRGDGVEPAMELR